MKRRLFTTASAVTALLGAASLYGCGKTKPDAAPAKKDKAVDAARRTDTSPAPQAQTPSGKVIVGVDDTYMPVSFRDHSGVLVGYEVDMIQEAFKRMGMSFEFKPFGWEKMEDYLIKDKVIDIVWCGLFATEARKAKFAFSHPYRDGREIAIVKASSPFKHVSELGGKVIGGQGGTATITILEKFRGTNGPVARIEKYPETTAFFVALLEGQVDAVSVDDMQGLLYVSRSPGKFRVLDGAFDEQPVAVAMRKEETELLDKINKAIDSMKADGTFQKIYTKWFSEK